MPSKTTSTERNSLPFILVGALLAIFFWQSLLAGAFQSALSGRSFGPRSAWAETPEADQPNEIHLERIETLAETDHIALLEWAQQRHKENVTDYKGIFYKRERLGRQLRPTEKIAIAFMEKPFSLVMSWKRNAGRADKMLYVKGKNDNKMLVHPTGLFSFIKSVKKDPCAPDVLKNTLRPCVLFGFTNSIKSLLEVYRQADEQGDLTTRSLGTSKLHGRKVVLIERILPKGKGYPAARAVVGIDVEHVLPVLVRSYDWKGRLLSEYSYANLEFNTGLTNDDFTPKANGL